MTTTFETFMDSVKKIKHPSEKVFDAGETMMNMLNRIEFTNEFVNEPGYGNLVASTRTEMMVTFKTTDPRALRCLIKNWIRFYTIAIDIMVVQAKNLAEDQGKILTRPDRLARIFHQKKMTRAMKRVSTAEGVYAKYIHEEQEEDMLPETLVTIQLNAFIFRTIDPNKYNLMFTGATKNLRHDVDKQTYSVTDHIETLF